MSAIKTSTIRMFASTEGYLVTKAGQTIVFTNEEWLEVAENAILDSRWRSEVVARMARVLIGINQIAHYVNETADASEKMLEQAKVIIENLAPEIR